MQTGISEGLVELLRETGLHSSDFIDQILGTSTTEGTYHGVDGKEALLCIMQSLLMLCGSEEAAVDWLFHSVSYQQINGNYPYLALENGDFWSLTVLQDWLQIIVRHRASCPDLIAEIFQK